MNAHEALQIIRNRLCDELLLIALDKPLRTKAQYFRTRHNLTLGLLLGDLVDGHFAYQQVDLLLEPCQLPSVLEKDAEQVGKPYRGSSTEQPTKNIFLKNAQTRLRVETPDALQRVLAWYACLSREALVQPRDGGARVESANIMPSSAGVPTQPKSGPTAKPIVLGPVQPTVKPVAGQRGFKCPDSGLLIRSPWVDKILAGDKTWEMRSRQTNLRGEIALIQAGSGLVVGVARIVDCLGPLCEEEMRATFDRHGIGADRLVEVAQYRFAWVLEDVRPLVKPVPYLHRSGAVIFATLDAAAKTQIAAQLAS